MPGLLLPTPYPNLSSHPSGSPTSYMSPSTGSFDEYFFNDTQWPQHIPLDHILSQPFPTVTLAQYITAFTQRITRPLTTLDHKIVYRLAHITGLLCRSHLMYHPGYLIDTLESHMEHYGTMLIRGLGHIIAAGTPHITTYLTKLFFSPPSLLHDIPIFTVTLPKPYP